MRVRDEAGRQTQVALVARDLSGIDGLPGAAEELFLRAKRDDCEYARTTFVNNAASLGVLSYIGQNNLSAAAMGSYVQLNMTSANFLTGALVQSFRDQALATRELRVVNVTSIAGVQSFPSWGLYCSVKAGREMFHNTLALEWAEDPRLKVLNYAPGPLDTNVGCRVVLCCSMSV